MNKETMRKRGWSIHSDQTKSSKDEQDDDEQDDDQHSALADDDDDFDEHEKKQLLDSFPQQDDDSNEDEDMWGEKKAKPLDTNSNENNGDEEHNSSTSIAELAKTKLSKWAARLFDPDRPRGVIEPPQVIPLNDEFLTAFGKREKDYDQKLGRSIDIAESIQDDDGDEVDTAGGAVDLTSPAAASTEASRKVKIANLLFTMTEDQLRAACERFGPVQEVNLIMNRENPDRNSGRAYVIFETVDGAESCIDKLETLGGRALRVALASELPKRKSSGGMGGGMLARYWDKDISTKCFRCGKVGHIEANCPNEAKPKPCPLCAQPGHDIRNCAISRVCFRCGIPGHLNRDCTYKHNLPKRMVCSICFQSGHYRTNCRRRATDAPSHDAKCMVCGKTGHFLCTELKWFFGLQGVSCFNCGRLGHIGFECDRPSVDMCSRDEGVAAREIERATAESL
jgi:cellular nucleic acid-binding protein